MTSTDTATAKTITIEDRLGTCRSFLAYVRANALLHDADKLSAAYLKWSLAGGKKPTADYPGHTAKRSLRLQFLQQKMSSFLPYENDLKVDFPCSWTATEPTMLRQQALTDLLAAKLDDQDFISQLEDSDNPNYKTCKRIIAASKAADETAREKAMRSFFGGDYTPILTDRYFTAIKEEFDRKEFSWMRKDRAGNSLYDFYQWHHEPAFWQKTDPDIPTVVSLFTAGTAGLDGLDTGYETEPQRGSALEHHRPQLPDEEFLISTPFGSERKVALKAAEEEAHNVKLGKKIEKVHNLLRQPATEGSSNPFTALAELEAALQQAGEQTIIRTGRPINDITLADHSLSTAALAGAHAARVALETAVCKDGTAAYALPLRGKLRPKDSEWPGTTFAIFTCAVNADRLDKMALDLKDIAAIRQQVKNLLDHFISEFTDKLPVGGLVYRDQYGAHLVVPVLGNPARRWLAVGKEDSHQWSSGPPTLNWIENGNGPTNDEFIAWLLATAEEKLGQINLDFGGELLILLRHQEIDDQLNRLADAISWTRTAAGLGIGLPNRRNPEDSGALMHSFPYPNKNEPDASGSIDSSLCPVCGRRPMAVEKKCTICRERTDNYEIIDIWKEMPDLQNMAVLGTDRRLALLSVALDLGPWLGELCNSGIFCYKPGDKRFEKEAGSQRSNSFGRLRRIWRASELLLDDLHGLIPGWAGITENDDRRPLRTILLQPQDLQVIMPVERAGTVIDNIIAAFHEAFGRVAGRVAIHLSLVVFPFRTPIYLVLDGGRRLQRAGLDTRLRECELEGNGKLRRTDAWGERQFTYEMAITTTQRYQTGDCPMSNKDQFHANICTGIDRNGIPKKWHFADLTDKQDAYMVRNRLSLAEVGGGLVLDELSRPAEELLPSRCHSIPLEYWPTLKRLLTIQRRHLAGSQRRRLRTILANRERLWDQDDPVVEEVRELAAELLWRNPSCLGPREWDKLDDATRRLLIDSCHNGALFFGGLVEKRLPPETT